MCVVSFNVSGKLTNCLPEDWPLLHLSRSPSEQRMESHQLACGMIQIGEVANAQENYGYLTTCLIKGP